jgi:hypothetical protein
MTARAAEPPPPPATVQKTAPLQTQGLSRQQIAEKLRMLSTTEPKHPLGSGAMCYQPRALPESTDYVCPKCHARTHYANDSQLASFIVAGLPAARKAQGRISGLDVRLDESEFCEKCRAKISSSPQLILVVTFPDGTSQRTRGVQADDLDLVLDLLAGEVVHRGSSDEESALKDHLPRLRELLGMEEKPAK